MEQSDSLEDLGVPSHLHSMMLLDSDFTDLFSYSYTRGDTQRILSEWDSIQESIKQKDLVKMNMILRTPMHKVSVENREALLALLDDYVKQWNLSEKLLPGCYQSTSPFAETESFQYNSYHHTKKISLFQITSLRYTIEHIDQVGELFFSALKLNSSSVFRLPGATNVDSRNQADGRRWKNKLKEEYWSPIESNNAPPKTQLSPTITLPYMNKQTNNARATATNSSPKLARGGRAFKAGRQPNMSEQNKYISFPDQTGRRISKQRGNSAALLSPQASEKPKDKEKDLAWCPVLGEYIPSENVCAAHIVPHAWGYPLAQAIFSDRRDGREVIWDVRNGLLMCKEVEEAFDRGKIILVPVDNKKPDFDEALYEIKVVILDRTLLDDTSVISPWGPEGEQYNWKRLDGRQLDFRGVLFRPRRRYLFFNYLHVIIRTAMQRPPEYEYMAKRLESIGTHWATPGDYMAKGLLNMFKTRAEKGHKDLKRPKKKVGRIRVKMASAGTKPRNSRT